MDLDFYLIVGALCGGITFIIGCLCPIAYLCLLWSKNFILDSSPKEYSDTPSGKIEKKFCIPDNYLGLYLFLSFCGSMIISLAWPLALFAACCFGMLLFLRLSSRLKRHVATKNAHAEKTPPSGNN
jgi:hypothetical protein